MFLPFDLTAVDPDSLTLEGVPPIQVVVANNASSDCSTSDGDGYDDLMLHFPAADVLGALALDDDATVPLTLSGLLREEFGGARIEGIQMATFSFKGPPH